MPILAVTEQRAGTLRRVSLETVTAARGLAEALATDVHAVLLGPPGSAAAAAELARFGADRILVGESDALVNYSPEAFTAVLAAVIDKGEYAAVLFPASALGRDLAPRLAARLDLPLATDATAIEVKDGELVITRPIFGGRAFARIALDAKTRFVSLRPNVFRPRERQGGGQTEMLELQLQPESWRVRVRELRAASEGRPDVGEAPIVVSGGRGLRGPENWGLLEDLCQVIGPRCSLGASRAVVDAGWRPHSEQVGQTGKTVAPQLYIAVGISGAIQHLAGMRTAATIVAINKDADAPIFKVADYGIVGDVFEVLPRLTEEVRRLREQE
jgi:electron transfer flavoprotein alpha subunit